MENFVLYDELGRGEQRIVYKGRRKGTINYFAIHCVDKTKREDLQNYVRISHSLNHKNIVNFFEWYETSNHLWLVVELCSGISLETILAQDGCLPEEIIRKFGRDVVEGLFYLHSQDIIYCDLTPSKVILDGSGILKLSNFTLAKVEGEQDEFDDYHDDIDFEGGTLEDDRLSKRLVRGLPFYVAPEVLQGSPHTKYSDLWSLGCLIFECFAGTPPYVATQFEELLSKIVSNDLPVPIQKRGNSNIVATDSLKSLLGQLLVKEPSQRLSLPDLCKHEFWKGALDHLVNENHSDMKALASAWQQEDSCGSSIDTFRSAGPVAQKANMLLKETSKVNQGSTFKGHDLDDQLVVDDSLVSSQTELTKMSGVLGKGLAVLDLRNIGKASLDLSLSISKERESYCQSRHSKRKTDRSTDICHSAVVDPTCKEENSLDCGINLNLIDLLYHPSDVEVSPIIDNPKIQKQKLPKWDPHQIPFAALKLDKLHSLTKQETELHVQVITEGMSSQSSAQKGADGGATQRQRLHVLAYVYSIAHHEKIANMLLEKNFTRFLLNDLKNSTSQELKMRAGHLLGRLACSATYISPELKMTEIFSALTETIRDNLCITKLKMVLLTALGEFLFYAATQEEGEDKRISNWDPPGASFTIVARCLQQGEDVTVQHTAAKIIENIATTAGRYCKKFVTKEVAHSLWSLFSHAITDAEKHTAISALCRLTMHSNTIFQHVVERVGMDEVIKTLFAGSNRVQQSMLTMIITLLSNATHFKRISQDANVICKVVRMLESPSLVLRGKVYLFVTEIISKSVGALLECCHAKIVTYIERDSRKTASKSNTKADAQAMWYLKQCLELVITTMLTQVPVVISGIVKALDAVSGRQHPPSSLMKQLRACLPHLSILLYVVTSQVFRPRMIDDFFVESLGALMNHMQSADSGHTNINGGLGPIKFEEIVRTTFSIVEAVSQHPLLLLQYRDMVIQAILPSVGAFCTSSSGDHRMLALKLFSDVASLYLENDDCDKSARGKTADKPGKILKEVISEFLIERIDIVLQDQDPIPTYGLKLLHSYLDRNKETASALAKQGMVAKIIDLFETHQDDTQSSALLAMVNVIASMTSAVNTDIASVYKQGLVEYLMSAFIAVSSVLDEDTGGDRASLLFLPLLDTLRHLLKCLEAGVKRVVRLKGEEKSKDEISREVAHVEDLLTSSKILSGLNGVLITLLCFDDEDVQDWSCQCLYLSAELFGGEYEESFSEDNLECMSDAIQMCDNKRKKLLLRIVKRFATSSRFLLRVLKENGEELINYLEELSSGIGSNQDQKAIQAIAAEILALVNSN